VTTASAQKRVPSLRSRQPSCSLRPLALGPLQHALRHAGGALLRRVEHREMLADDLVRAVALDALGARVPAHHPAGGVQQEDGVLGDALDQQAELLVGGVVGGREPRRGRIQLHGADHSTHFGV
jgi:hypothetical protein